MNFKEKFLHFINPYKSFVTFSELGNYGRLGNQLFQYAAVRSYSLKHDLPLLLPKPIEHKLGNFHISCQYVNRNTLQVVNRVQFEERQFHFDLDFFNYHPRIDFKGYFQSEKYFRNYRDVLLKEFILKDRSVNNYCNQYIKKIKSENGGKQIVSLHNRRGDNVPSQSEFSDPKLGVFLPDKDLYHPLLSMEYINQSKSLFEDAVFLIFSDNQEGLEWCKKNINGPNHYFSEGHDDLTDFTLMRNCDHNIIANSSFSWWASWLNENPNKKVIAPKIWFGNAYNDWSLKDLIPDSWIVN